MDFDKKYEFYSMRNHKLGDITNIYTVFGSRPPPLFRTLATPLMFLNFDDLIYIYFKPKSLAQNFRLLAGPKLYT